MISEFIIEKLSHKNVNKPLLCQTATILLCTEIAGKVPIEMQLYFKPLIRLSEIKGIKRKKQQQKYKF